MPPTRRIRTSHGPAAKGSQKTISFGTPLSKPNTPSASLKDKTNNTAPPSTSIPPPSSKPDVGHVTPFAAVAQQAKVELEKDKTEEEKRAERVTDAQIKKYWREREKERKAPRVHQGDLGVEEKILRYFDISSQYGPCIGIARMKRWVRANKLGLNPPIEVLAVLLREESKENDKVERAYVDELMNSKFVVGEA